MFKVQFKRRRYLMYHFSSRDVERGAGLTKDNIPARQESIEGRERETERERDNGKWLILCH